MQVCDISSRTLAAGDRGTHRDCVHHVTTRSIAEERIFKDGGDFTTGVTLLGGLVKAGLLLCHAFCFMPTHYHVLGTFDDVTKFVHKLNRRYAVAYNRRYRRRGHVFDSPPSVTPVESDRHLRNALRYIALNPSGHEDWAYSSYPGLVGVRQPFSFVDTRPIVEMVGSGEAIREFVAKDL